MHGEGVPDATLQPRTTWADPAAYDRAARRLAQRFRNNIAAYQDRITPEALAAGPS